MDLRTFVSETLLQIVQGVSDAQSLVDELGTNARINPGVVSEAAKKKSGTPQPVEFDVALTVSDEQKETSGEKVGGSAGLLSVVSLKASAELNSASAGSKRNESVSRVRFTVQLAQPSDLVERPVQPKRSVRAPNIRPTW